MVALPAYAPRMSVREFLNWDPGDGLRYELVDGEPRAMAPAGTTHGLLQNEIGTMLAIHLRTHRPDCVTLANPGVVPRFLSAYNFRIPDLAVSCASTVAGLRALPDPVLLIEILSPSNQAETWSNVRAYTSIPSVQEILVFHTARMAAELLRRRADGGWPDEPDPFEGGDVTLGNVGFTFSLPVLYARTGLSE